MRRVPFIVLVCASASSAIAVPVAAPPNGGTIAMEAKTADGQPLAPAFRDGLVRTFSAKGFTILNDPAHAGYVADITVREDTVGMATERNRRDPVGMAGAGASIPLRSGGYTTSALQRTRLEIKITRHAGGVVWQGAAVTVRPIGTTDGMIAATAQDLSAALLSGYPAQPEDVVGVP